MAKIPYLDISNSSEETRSTWERVKVSRGASPMPSNLYRLLAYSPAIMENWSHLAQSIRGFDREGRPIGGPRTLERRHYFIAVLEVARSAPNAYEWNNHSQNAHRYGLSDLEVAAIGRQDYSKYFSKVEIAIIRYTTDVVLQRDTESSFRELSHYLAAQTMVELTIAISFYVCIARFVNALGIEPEVSRL